MKVDYAAGSYESIKDFGVAGQADYVVNIDVDELSGASYRVDIYTRETETDGWWLIGGIGSEAVDTSSMLSLQRYRYVKTVVTTTGGDNPAGVIGY